MVLVRAWVKGELEAILQVGMNSPPVASRRFRSTRRQHVQCVEVDEGCSALKINDGETMVWCFVTKQGMDKVIRVGGIDPFFIVLGSVGLCLLNLFETKAGVGGWVQRLL